MEYRSSLVTEIGGKILSHRHSYSHVAFVTRGWFGVQEVTVNGIVKYYQVANGEFRSDDPRFAPIANRILIPAGHAHEFTLMGSTGVGEVLCVWPAGELRPSGWAE